MNIIQWQLSFWYWEGWGHSCLSFNLYSYWMLSIFDIKKYLFITWKTIFWEAQVIKRWHRIHLFFAISTNHLLIISQNSITSCYLSIILILFFFICLSYVSYISKAIFRRKWYGFNGCKKNKTTIYYMRNELVSTFTDMTRLVNMVETRKLRNFLKTFF